ncbi:MAG: DUF3987 domain-containing protein [Desulfobulbaceae bacterium]|nr:DUF3987 domain-containing protein [Desulfobulbaceae bacterium]
MIDTTSKTMHLDAALSYAKQGWPVFPCNVNKTPKTKNGFKDATTDEKIIQDWWRQFPDASIGVATGSASWLFVLDVDLPDGPNSLARLEQENGPLPATLEQRTGTGGRHLFFKNPEGVNISISAGKIGPNLDTRCQDGYVIAPPSCGWDNKAQKETGTLYEWTNTLPVIEAPGWLVDLVLDKQTRVEPVPVEGKGRPGDDFNKRGDSRPLLQEIGWSFYCQSGTNERWSRPGKTHGASATIFDDGSIYNFSGNAGPFEANKRYSPFSVYSILKHGGDFKAAALTLAGRGYGAPSAQTGTGIDWPETSPLIVHQQASPYPLDYLPGIIGAAVSEVVDFVQCPVALGACSALAVVSTVCQGLVDVRRAETLEGPTSLFLLAIADSGERKTTVDGHFSKPVYQWGAEQKEAARPALQKYEAEQAAWEAKKSGLLSAIKDASKSSKATEELERKVAALELEKPNQPKIPDLTFGDSTPEALAYRLAHGWPVGGVLSSEAGTVFGSHAMGKDSAMRNMAMLNTLWDAKELKVDRRTSPSYTVRGARLTMGLAVQSETVRAFLEGSKGLARGIGWLARFLIAWPESTQGGRMFKDPPENCPHLAKFHRRLGTLLDLPLTFNDRDELEPNMLELSPEAKAEWVAFHDYVEAELRPGRDMAEAKDVASKAADNAARLAALFHLFENNPGGAIGLDHMRSAAVVVNWHLYEARRFMGEIALPVELNNATKLDAWLLVYCQQERVMEVPTTVIQQNGPPATREKRTLDPALAGLEEAGRVRVVKEGRRKLVKINPALIGVWR